MIRHASSKSAARPETKLSAKAQQLVDSTFEITGRAVSKAVRTHHAAGRAVAFEVGGKIRWLQPDGSVTTSEKPKSQPKRRAAKSARAR
jgi:hypothetical protein